MATINGSPHLQIRHNLSGLYLADYKWLHPIVIAFNTLCPVEFYIKWCVALHHTHWGWYLKKIICPCLGSWFSQKATTFGSPPNFSKLIYQSWGIMEPWYFITLLLDYYWTYFSKHYLYHKKTTKFGSQNFGYQIWFCTRLIKMASYQYRKSHYGDKTILRPCYLHNGISHTGKMTSLYWIRAQNIFTITA